MGNSKNWEFEPLKNVHLKFLFLKITTIKKIPKCLFEINQKLILFRNFTIFFPEIFICTIFERDFIRKKFRISHQKMEKTIKKSSWKLFATFIKCNGFYTDWFVKNKFVFLKIMLRHWLNIIFHPRAHQKIKFIYRQNFQ